MKTKFYLTVAALSAVYGVHKCVNGCATFKMNESDKAFAVLILGMLALPVAGFVMTVFGG